MTISRQDLYYLLGFGFLDYRLVDEKLVLTKHRSYRYALEEITYKLFGRFITKGNGLVLPLPIDNHEVATFLKDAPKKHFPVIADEYAWSFICGYFDGYGEFIFKDGNPKIFVQSPNTGVIEFISKFWKVKTNFADKVNASGSLALDLCGKMYEKRNVKNPTIYNAFMDVLNIEPNKAVVGREEHFEYMKLHPSAVPPHKTNATDSGYDLHIVEFERLYTTSFGAGVYQGKTKLGVRPIFGYSFDLNGRSSLPKKEGWQFMQGTGLIDAGYYGEIQGTFLKLDDREISLPLKAMQLVPRETPLRSDFKEVKSLGESQRGTGGFGSTSKA